MPRAGFATSTVRTRPLLPPDSRLASPWRRYPPLVRDADPRPGKFGWLAWAEPAVGDSCLWCASFSSSVPQDLIAIFASSLASPHPVQRSCLPDGVEGRLTVIHPETRRQRRARRPE
ncbi:DUF317 domain-containing protein [Streptomyces sp. NPDC059593]|uniref:DUF317 domain-containing protein n=1 Tax=Streptomyces sp. NPDC059593 TaxID=3346878 RepID=UPI00367F8437